MRAPGLVLTEANLQGFAERAGEAFARGANRRGNGGHSGRASESSVSAGSSTSTTYTSYCEHEQAEGRIPETKEVYESRMRI